MTHPLYALVLTLFAVKCYSDAPTNRIESIELRSRTRGYNSSILIDPSTLTFKEDQHGTKAENTQSISVEQWTGLVASLKQLRMVDIKDLASPTDKIAVDQSMISHLIITLDNGEVISSGVIDLSQPPTALIGCLDQIKFLNHPY